MYPVLRIYIREGHAPFTGPYLKDPYTAVPYDKDIISCLTLSHKGQDHFDMCLSEVRAIKAFYRTLLDKDLEVDPRAGSNSIYSKMDERLTSLISYASRTAPRTIIGSVFVQRKESSVQDYNVHQHLALCAVCGQLLNYTSYIQDGYVVCQRCIHR